MAHYVNRYESVLLDKMLEIKKGLDGDVLTDSAMRDAASRIFMLLDCIDEFREPLGELAIEDGYGAMVQVVDA